MNDTSIQTTALARRRLQRPPPASIVRWIPLVLPLLAALMACDAYAIAWVAIGLYR